ncbi:MAG: hypothetical protein ABL961_15675 [Vicinamibacterales bacterium]
MANTPVRRKPGRASEDTFDPVAIIRRIHKMYPTPPGTPPRAYDVHDRHAAAAAIREHLKRKRS